jgi:hypothetical protein
MAAPKVSVATLIYYYEWKKALDLIDGQPTQPNRLFHFI